jgi:tRNA-binding protein
MAEEFRPATIKPTVTLDDLNKLDIRVGTIERVEDVQNSARLIRLRVNFGDHQRSIPCGDEEGAFEPAC